MTQRDSWKSTTWPDVRDGADGALNPIDRLGTHLPLQSPRGDPPGSLRLVPVRFAHIAESWLTEQLVAINGAAVVLRAHNLLVSHQSLLVAVTCVVAVVIQPHGQSPASLPAGIRAELTAAFPGWRIAAANASIDLEWRRAFPEGTPNVLRGDYDGDGTLDYAVLVEYTRGGPPAQPQRVNRAVAFLRRASGFRMFALTDPVEFNANDGLHLWPVAKGKTSTDLDTDKEFTYERDAVSVLFDSKGPCTSFIYRNGAFRSIWTCD